MQQIFDANQTILSLLGAPKPTGEEFRFTRFCVRCPCGEGELFYNTLTGELLLLPEGETLAQNRELLFEKRFLVPERLDEYARAAELRKILRLVQPRTQFDSFLIYTTTDCNARCYYCYEHGRPRIAMTDRTADDVADFILRQSGDRRIKLTWFGGEPLYNRRAIDRICARLRKVDKPYRSKIISNGYLFDEETVETAVRDWQLGAVQIVLDGTEEVHNRAKAFIYRDDPSPFRRVLRNIGLLADAGVRVNIRLNLGTENFEDLAALIRELGSHFKGNSNISVYIALLWDFGTSPQDALSWEERFRRQSELEHLLDCFGLIRRSTLRGKLNVSNCMADDDAHVTILPDGSIGRCEHEEWDEAVGNIYDGVLDPARAAAWKETVDVPDCRACELYPRCRRLKKCAWTEGKCLPLDRALFRQRVIDEMLYTYENWKSGRAVPEEDDGGHDC